MALGPFLKPVSLSSGNKKLLPENSVFIRSVDICAAAKGDFASIRAANTSEIDDRSVVMGLMKVSESADDSGGQIEIKSPPGPNLHIGSALLVFSLMLFSLV